MSTPRAAALTWAGVRAGYGRTVVLDGVDLRVEPGELVGIVGPSGSGKTTLLKLAVGELGAYRGAVSVFGEQVHLGRPSGDVGYVAQLGRADPDFPLVAETIVLLGRTAKSARLPWFTRPERAQANAMLERLGLIGLGRRQLSELSGGQRQRVLLARALMGGSRVILLDEPTSGIDLASRAEVLRLLGELGDDGITIVLTTHDLNWVAAQLPRIVCLNKAVLADGTPTAVFTPDVLRATFGTAMRVVRDGTTVFVADEEPLIAAPLR